MTDLVTPAASVGPVTASLAVAPPAARPADPAASAPVSPAPKADAPAPQQTAAETQRRPLTVDVQRDAGVFVYTLRDPVTDTVLAVIPREAVRADRDGRHVDQKV